MPIRLNEKKWLSNDQSCGKMRLQKKDVDQPGSDNRHAIEINTDLINEIILNSVGNSCQENQSSERRLD